MATAKNTGTTTNEDAAAASAASQPPVQPEETVSPSTPGASEADLVSLRAELEALRTENTGLRTQLGDAAAGKMPAPDGHVWVVNKDGSPIPSVPHAPESWLKEFKHLLPEGARKATKDEQDVLAAAEAAKSRPAL